MTLTLLRHPSPQIDAGDSIEFLQAIPSDRLTWTGSARLTGPSQMDATSVDTEGADFHVKFEGQSTGGTKDLAAGQYTLTVWASEGNDRYTVRSFPITIRPDLSTGEPAQPFAAATLAIVESAIQARLSGNADGGIEEYELLGRRVKKYPMQELYGLRTRLQAELRMLNNNGHLPSVKVQFGAPDFFSHLIDRNSRE